MSTPHLRVLPNPTADAMELLGETKIADVLGTYATNKDESDRHLKALAAAATEPAHERDEVGRNLARDIYAAWRVVERRLFIYQLLREEKDGTAHTFEARTHSAPNEGEGHPQFCACEACFFREFGL